MGDNCKDCLYFKNLQEQTKKNEEDVKDLNLRVGTLERNNAVDREKMDNFNRMLEKIDKGISNIQEKMDDIEKKPIAFWDKVVSAVIGSVITFIVIEAVKRFKG